MERIFGSIVAICMLLAAFPANSAEIELPQVLNLSTAKRIALQDNPSLHAAEARVEQAAARLKQARSLYFPAVGTSASASYTDLAENTVDLLPPGADDSVDTYRASINANWLVFDGFARRFRNISAKLDEARFEAAYQESRRLLLSALARSYYNVQLARENIEIAMADEAFNQRQLVEAEARQRVGTGSLSDVLNFQVRVRSAQTLLIQAEGNHRLALVVLSELMGVPEAHFPPDLDVAPLTPELPEELIAPELIAAIEYAAAHRPDVEEVEYLVDQANAGVRINQASYYPTIAAIAMHEAERIDDAGIEDDDFATTVGLTLSFDIFTGGRRRGQVQEARAFRTEARRLRDQVSLAVASDVRQRYQNLVTSQQELLLQRETTQYVEQNRDLVEKEYNAGQGSLVRLNEAQRDLIAQRSRLALAQVAMRLSWHNLRTATGEVLEPYRDRDAEATSRTD